MGHNARLANFKHDKCVAVAATVIVQMHETTRKSWPLSEQAKLVLTRYVE